MWTAIAIAAGLAITGTAVKGVNDTRKYNYDEPYKALNKDLRNYANIESNKEFQAYMRDAQALGYIDGKTNKNALAAYNKLRDYNWDYTELSRPEMKSLTTLYNNLYANDANFKSLWDDKYSNMSNEEKLAWLDGASTSGASIPAPAYLDTSFDTYQKEVAPLKLYTNKELADLYNLDYDVDNILKDYEAGAQAKVDYSTWLSDLAANNAERDNVTNTTSYLDAIRANKNKAVLKGMSNGARAAADVLTNREAIQNKVNTNTETAVNRFQTMNDSLLERAQAEINANKMYTDLGNALTSLNTTLYANDVNRLGQDLLTNANILSADENLRSNRQAQNNLMASIYNNVSAQNRAANGGVNNVDWLFKNVYLPAANGNVDEALSDFIGTQYSQQSGYADPATKWGSGN